MFSWCEILLTELNLENIRAHNQPNCAVLYKCFVFKGICRSFQWFCDRTTKAWDYEIPQAGLDLPPDPISLGCHSRPLSCIHIIRISHGPCQAKTCPRACADCAHSHPPAHAQSLLRAFALRWTIVSNDSICGQRRRWSDCADAQADLGLRCPHMPEDTAHMSACFTLRIFVRNLFGSKSAFCLSLRTFYTIIPKGMATESNEHTHTQNWKLPKWPSFVDNTSWFRPIRLHQWPPHYFSKSRNGVF